MDAERKQVEAARAIRKAQEELSSAEFSERQVMFARASFSKYKALVAAGFTEAQAIQIVAVSPY